jgi:hypothetical protein
MEQYCGAMEREKERTKECMMMNKMALEDHRIDG